MDIEELEMIEGIQEESGPSMLDILRGKQSGSMRNAAVREHIFHVMRLSPSRPARQSDLLHAALRPLADALPRPPQDQAPASRPETSDVVRSGLGQLRGDAGASCQTPV
ncbi:hypothetical protein [Streptomyces mirabilis]|uniref:hypothetical protein n=1 Tax=Streptomyces mirabilis TaxID=68239 RepID=UPI0036BD6AF0